MVCDQLKSARTHAHRTHILEVFSHAHACVRPHIAHMRARTHLCNPCLGLYPLIRIYTAFFRPGNAEAYLCTPMKLDKSNTNYIIGFEPTAHKDTAHHMILYGCKSPARQEAIYNCGGMDY